MPDPSVSDALAEAYALAPGDEIVLHTLEVRHPAFVDADGNPDSIWVVANSENVTATIEESAPIRGGEAVTFVGLPFAFRLPPVEPGATPEIELQIDNVDRRIVENLDLAVSDGNKIVVVYRPFLASDLTQPQMDPPPAFDLSDVRVDIMKVTARARTSIDLRGAFPRRLYTAREFPGLVGR